MVNTMVKEDEIYTVQKPAVAVDVVLFTIVDDDLKVGLTRREEEPYLGKYALPGRFVRYDEPIEMTAKMALQLKGGVDPKAAFLEQLYTFGEDLHRDTRIRTISVVYYGMVDASVLDAQGKNKFIWHSVYDLPPLSFDHKEIILYAVERLRNKVWGSDFAYQLMPDEFTLSELQRAYEVILHETLDKRNFRKKILEIHILKDLQKQKMEGAHRPAAVYGFVRGR